MESFKQKRKRKKSNLSLVEHMADPNKTGFTKEQGENGLG